MRRYFSSTPLFAQQFSLLTKTSLVFSVGFAVACDTEGQDPAVLDADGDYIADDLGTPLDKNGDGQITRADYIDINADGIIDGVGIDVDGDGVPDGVAIDTDGDGVLDTLDPDGSGAVMVGTGGSASGGAMNGTGGGSVGPGTGGGLTGNGGTTPGTGGGSPGTGGAFPGTGGGSPGTGGAPGGGTGGGGGGPVACTINVSSSMVSPTMRTVGLVEFTSDLSGAAGASVEFGLDTSYGMTAPAESMGAGFRATLVGMKPDSTYHYRVVVEGPGGSCAGSDQTIETGGNAQGITKPTMAMTGAGASPGFMIVATGTQAIILDKDGDVVWGSAFPAQAGGSFIGVTSAKLSWDGKYVIARDLGPFDAGSGGNMWRVPLDGSSDPEKLNVSGGHHHDFTVTPDGIAYIAKQQAGQCDHIFTANADGSGSQSLVDLDVVFGQYPQAGFGGEACHVNSIKYYPDRQIFSVSDREKDVIAVLGTDGSLKTAIGQQPSGSLSVTPVIAEGAKTTWRVQHGHDYYEDNKLLVFSNHDFGSQQSPVLHYTINGANAALDWQYSGHPGSSTQGDVEMLPNGNVLVTSSTGGEIHEISSSQQLIGQYRFQGAQIGYVDHRTSLYGPPD